jgi:hypothetical protein
MANLNTGRHSLIEAVIGHRSSYSNEKLLLFSLKSFGTVHLLPPSSPKKENNQVMILGSESIEKTDKN